MHYTLAIILKTRTTFDQNICYISALSHLSCLADFEKNIIKNRKLRRFSPNGTLPFHIHFRLFLQYHLLLIRCLIITGNACFRKFKF